MGIQYFNSAATHELVNLLFERVDALEAEVAFLRLEVGRLTAKQDDRSGLLEASGLIDIAEKNEAAKEKKAAYMRDYMAKKRAERRGQA